MFSHVFGNDDDTFTNGLFGMDCLQDSKAVITSYILVLCSFQRPLISIVYFYVNNDLETDCRGILTAVFVSVFFFFLTRVLTIYLRGITQLIIDEEELEPRLYLWACSSF